MAKFFKAMCVAFLAAEIAASVYLCANVIPVFTAVERSYNEQFSLKIAATGFNTGVFIVCLVVSVFFFAAFWCFGDVAAAAKKYLSE